MLLQNKLAYCMKTQLCTQTLVLILYLFIDDFVNEILIDCEGSAHSLPYSGGRLAGDNRILWGQLSR